MYEKIKSAIAKHLETHRLVFWYDAGAKHRAVLEELSFPGQVLEIANNEWWIKYHVLKEHPTEHFLVYAPHEQPADGDNWLLDLVFAGFAFSHDLSETFRNELGLGPEFQSFFSQHVAFFQNTRDRFEPLQAIVDPANETPATLAVKMMGISTAPDADSRRLARPFGRILFDLAVEAFAESSQRWDAIKKFSLERYFVDEVRRYVPEVPDNIEPSGAAISVFREAWTLELGEEATSSRRNCRVLLDEWREQFGTGERFQGVVEAVEDVLKIADQVKSAATDTLARLHLFPAVDSELANRLVENVTKPEADWESLREIASSRIGTYWVRGESRAHIEAIYELVARYVDFERAMHAANVTPGAAEELVRRYVNDLYQVDHLYRCCLSAYRRAGARGSLATIAQRLDGLYLHQFLQPLAEAWDSARQGRAVPDTTGLPHQRRFFDTVVAPYLERGDKLVVIVSDALRYEAGRELGENISGINRLSAEASPMLASVPTVTAVGMNALLPHRRLTYSADGGVRIDGEAINGVEGRSAHLDREVRKRFPEKRAAAFRANDVTQLSSAAARERINGLDLIYLYSNAIDGAADNAKTEDSLPDAVDEELAAIERTVRKFANQLNRSHILVTADHGFLYQHSAPAEPHLIAAEKPGGGIRERRYLVGGNSPGEHFVSADASELTLDGADSFHFAEGLYRIRKQGGGRRYVHGGLSLQELIIPLIRIRVLRSNDMEKLEVVLLKPAKATITTPTYGVRFFQTEPVTAKRPPIRVRGYFMAEDGTVVSDTVEMEFDSTDPNSQNRTREAEFHFGAKAVNYNGQKIQLKLEEMIGGVAVPYRDEEFIYRTFGERDF